MRDQHGEQADADAGGWRANFRHLWRLYREQVPEATGKLAAAAALLLAGIVLLLVFVFAAALLADRAAETPGGGLAGWAARHSSNQIAFFLAMVAVLITACGFFATIWFAEVGARATAELRKKLFGTLVTLPLSYFADQSRDEISGSIISDAAQLQTAWTREFRRTVQYLLVLLMAVITMFAVASGLAAAAIALLVPAVLVAWWLVFRRTEDSAPTTLGKVPDEVLHSLPVVKGFANENHERGRQRQRVDRDLANSLRSDRIRTGLVGGLGLLLMGLVLLLLWHGSREIDGRRFEAGVFVSFVILLGLAGGAAVQLGSALRQLASAAVSANRLTKLLEEEGEPLEVGSYLPESRERLDGRLSVDKIGFAYPAAPEMVVLEDIAFSASVGQRIAVVGSVGSGKSTLAALLIGLYEPQSGEVRIDDRPIGDYPLAWLRGQIGWVPEQADLFAGSVTENIAYGQPSALPVQVREAAEKAHALGFIEDLADGFETVLGGAGEVDTGGDDGRADSEESRLRLSPSQRRRIALARVFVEDPPIVVIDDAPAVHSGGGDDANTDAVAVRDAEDALMKGRTVVVVAHRLSTAREADEIIVLRDGRIAESGRHDDLYENRGFYRLLCEGDFGKS